MGVWAKVEGSRHLSEGCGAGITNVLNSNNNNVGRTPRILIYKTKCFVWIL